MSGFRFAFVGTVLISVVGATSCSASEQRSTENTESMGTLFVDGRSHESSTAGGSGAGPRGAEIDSGQVPQPVPGEEGECPYLESNDAQTLNGIRVGKVLLDTDFLPPACFFYDLEDRIALTTTIYTASSPIEATSAMEHTVPVDISEPVSLADGWSGGKNSAAGALLAVAKGNRVLVVNSVQPETIKVERLAQAILKRGL